MKSPGYYSSSVGVGLFIAFTLLALQYPIERTAFTFIQTTEEVEHLASLYFYICIWGAPAVLGLYSFAGWYIGMQNSRFPMYIAITQNIVNIAVSLLLVYGLGMKIEGVRHRNVNCTICRASHGIFVVVTLLQHPAETHRMAFLL